MRTWTRNPLQKPDLPSRPSWGKQAKSEFRLHIGLRTKDKRKTYHPDYVLELIRDFRPWPPKRGAPPPEPMMGATIWTGMGLWMGDYEPTMVVSTYVWPSDEANARQYMLQLAVHLAESLEQESVMVMEFPIAEGFSAEKRSPGKKAYDRRKTRARRRRRRPVRRIR